MSENVKRSEITKCAPIIRKGDASLYARKLHRKYGMAHENIVETIGEIWGPDYAKYIDGLKDNRYYAIDLGLGKEGGESR